MQFTALRQGGCGHNLWDTWSEVWLFKNTVVTDCAPAIPNQLRKTKTLLLVHIAKKP
jgi:hypothetical protein